MSRLTCMDERNWCTCGRSLVNICRCASRNRVCFAFTASAAAAVAAAVVASASATSSACIPPHPWRGVNTARRRVFSPLLPKKDPETFARKKLKRLVGCPPRAPHAHAHTHTLTLTHTCSHSHSHPLSLDRWTRVSSSLDQRGATAASGPWSRPYHRTAAVLAQAIARTLPALRLRCRRRPHRRRRRRNRFRGSRVRVLLQQLLPLHDDTQLDLLGVVQVRHLARVEQRVIQIQHQEQLSLRQRLCASSTSPAPQLLR